MTNWNSPDELLREANIFNRSFYTLFGIYIWELVTTMQVERALLFRTRPFKWPHILYFLCRYTLFFAHIGLLVSFLATTQINCHALYIFTQWAGNTTMAASSSLLLVRTIAIWKKSPFVIASLLLLAAGQWGLLYYGVTSVHAEWSPQQGQCVVTGTSPDVLKAMFIYTMGIDFTILVVTTSGLWFVVPGGGGGFWKMLFVDGIAYFSLIASVNTIPAVLNILDLNPVMNIIATIPATVVSTITATRLFRRLQDYADRDVYVHTSFSAGIPSAVGHNNRRPTQGKPVSPLAGSQNIGSAKTAVESSGKSSGLMPRFASFGPQDRGERHSGHVARHPLAPANGEESFLSANENPGTGTDTELPTLVSFASANQSERVDGGKSAALVRYGVPTVRVDVFEMEGSTHSPSGSLSSFGRALSPSTAPQEHYPGRAV